MGEGTRQDSGDAASAAQPPKKTHPPHRGGWEEPHFVHINIVFSQLEQQTLQHPSNSCSARSVAPPQ